MFALGATMFELASRKELPSGGQLYQDLRNSRCNTHCSCLSDSLPETPMQRKGFSAVICPALPDVLAYTRGSALNQSVACSRCSSRSLLCTPH